MPVTPAPKIRFDRRFSAAQIKLILPPTATSREAMAAASLAGLYLGNHNIVRVTARAEPQRRRLWLLWRLPRVWYVTGEIHQPERLELNPREYP